MVKLNNNPQRYLHPNPQNLQMLPYMAKKDFAAVIKDIDLEMGRYHGLFRHYSVAGFENEGRQPLIQLS